VPVSTPKGKSRFTAPILGRQAFSTLVAGYAVNLGKCLVIFTRCVKRQDFDFSARRSSRQPHSATAAFLDDETVQLFDRHAGNEFRNLYQLDAALPTYAPLSGVTFADCRQGVRTKRPDLSVMMPALMLKRELKRLTIPI
jgi:hypothetical protein